MKVLVILLVLVGFAGIAFAAPGFTSQEIHDFSDIIAVGEVTYVDSTFSPTMNLYHIQVEKFLKNPQDSTEILAVGSKTESIRAGNEVFDVGDRALFFLTDDIASIFPIYSEIYEISTVSQSMDPNWDKCNIFEKNIPPNHWVFGGRNNHLQVSQENKTDDFVTGKKITISYDVFNHEPVTKKVDFGKMVKNIDEPESLYEFTETADRILEPCTVYETISWSFTPSEPANYLAEFYDLKGHTTGITIPVKSDTGFSGVAPLKQWGNDIPFDEIQCKDGLVLIQKYDGTPACVTESTKTKLIERGWTQSLPPCTSDRTACFNQESNMCDPSGWECGDSGEIFSETVSLLPEPKKPSTVFPYIWNDYLHKQGIEFEPRNQSYWNTGEGWLDINRVCSPIVTSNGTELYISSVFMAEPFEIIGTYIDDTKPDDCHKIWKTESVLPEPDKELEAWLEIYHDKN